MLISQALTLLAGAVLGIVVAALVAWALVRRQIGRVQSALRAAHADGFAAPGGAGAGGAPVGGGYSTDDEDEAPPAEGPFRAVAEARCADCRHFSHAGGQQLLSAHPAFKQAVMARPLWKMGMGPKRRAFLDLEHQIFDIRRKAEITPPGAERALLEEQIAELEAKLKLEPEYDTRAGDGLARNMEVSVEDFGACVALQELRARADVCPKFERR